MSSGQYSVPVTGSVPANLVNMVRLSAERRPDLPVLTFLADGNTEERKLTCSLLDLRARAIAAHLQTRRVKGPALLFYNAGLEFIEAFYGCLFAGIVGVPAPVPGCRESARWRLLAEDSRADAALTTAQLVERTSERAGIAGLTWIATDEIDSPAAQDWRTHTPYPDDLAYLQYTSGSTSTPKGVMVSHANVLHNLAYIAEDFRTTSESILVNWLPHFHDMGLVYGIMAPVFGSFRCIFMSPASFLQRPSRWLRAVSHYSATHSGGPNFAYDLCAQRIPAQEVSGLDLANWNVAFNGAETVRRETMQRFANRFGSIGFRLSSFYPAYGLAETTLKVSCRANGEPVKTRTLTQSEAGQMDERRIASSLGAIEVVSCGKTHFGMQAVVVNGETGTCCRDGEIGEIWVTGPSVAQGYWRLPKETDATFRCTISAFPGRTFLRTGDLGFLAEGEIYITGRMKDLIIIRGLNHYPEDIEWSASKTHPEIRPGCCIAFSIESEGEERLILVCEMERNFQANPSKVTEVLRQALTLEHGIQPHVVVLVRAASIPKTSSGKVQRGLCRSQFLAGRLNVVYSDILNGGSSPTGVTLTSSQFRRKQTVLRELTEMAALVLEISEEYIKPEQSLTSIGLDSLHAANLSDRIRARWSTEISAPDLLACTSVNQLAKLIGKREPMAAQTPTLEDTVPEGAARLSLEQERLWLLDKIASPQSCCNLTAGIRFEGNLETGILRQSIQAAICRHSALRTSFVSPQGSPTAIIAPAAECEMNLVDLSDKPSPEEQVFQESVIERNRIFDLARPPLLRAKLLRLGEKQHVLLLTAHHIISDAHSMSVLASQIATNYEALARCGALSLAECTRYAVFAEQQRRQWEQHPRLDSLAYWRTALADAPTSINWPEMDSKEAEAATKVDKHSFEISSWQYERILAECRREGVTFFMWLLAIFRAALYFCTGQADIVLGIPVSGRNDQELDSVVGFIAHPVLIRIKTEENWRLRDLLFAVRDAALEAYRHQDVPFSKLVGTLRPNRSAGRPLPLQVMFSLIQTPDAILELPDLKITPVELPAGTSDLDLFVSVVQRRGGIRIWLQHNSRLLSCRFAEQIASSFQEILFHSVKQLSTALKDLRPARSSKFEPLVITIAATFRAELVEKPLQCWMKNLHTHSRIRFTAYNQLVQDLLDKDSQLSQNKHGVNILFVRLEDWDVVDKDHGSEIASGLQTQHIRKRITQFVQALRGCSRRSAVPFIVQLCLASPSYLERIGGVERFSELEVYTCSELATLDGVYGVSASTLQHLYPVENFYDKYSDEQAQMPYTSSAFAALGTMAARLIYWLTSPPKKVIVVDCDDTLWSGVCGEDGVRGIEIDEPRQHLQQFLIEQAAAGMLICLCSRNNEADVWQVFNERPEMKLAKTHLVSWRINWLPKSENLRSLAEELNLGLDSMLFLDDDPKECHEVQLNCPAVVAITLPQESGRISKFLQHLWALDHWKTTKEDRSRTTEYRNSILRTQIKQSSLSLEDFIQSLELHVSITAPRPEQMERMSQLTRRTNQFNMTMKQRSAAEIWDFLQQGGQAVVVEAKDRFGDYGLVGLLLFSFRAEALVIDTFLLSCRALGRKIEHKMFNQALELAQTRSASRVDIEFVETPKNAPALTFLHSMNPSIVRRAGCVTQFRFFAPVTGVSEEAGTVAAT